MVSKPNDQRSINAWAMYDWANSAYSLVINAAIFPIYYESVTGRNGNFIDLFGFSFLNTALYSWSLGFAYLLVASFSPFLSGIADARGTKKSFMRFFCYLGALSCALMFFFTENTIPLGIALVISSTIGHAGSLVFYNAYLPEISPKEQQDIVSAKGFALGYLGSTILLIFNLSMFSKPEWYGGISGGMAARTSFLSVGIWWILFAQIPFYFLKDKPTKKAFTKEVFLSGYRQLANIFRKAMRQIRLKRFLQAYFVFNMGVQTVILIATLFGKVEVKIEPEILLLVVLLIQIVAIGGAYLFSWFSTSFGNLNALKLATLIWSLVCLGGYFIHTALGFYILAVFVGLAMGGIQAISRSTYSKMLPPNEPHASYFSFYDFCEKLGIVIGMGIFGLISTLTMNLRTPILSLILFFVIGFLLLNRIPKEKNE